MDLKKPPLQIETGNNVHTESNKGVGVIGVPSSVSPANNLNNKVSEGRVFTGTRGRGTEGEMTQGNVYYIDDHNIMNSPNGGANNSAFENDDHGGKFT